MSDEQPNEGAPEAPPPAAEAPPAPEAPDVPPLTARDAEVLHAALARVCRMLGYNDEHMPEHTADIDATGVDARIAGLVSFAKAARLP
jgi:hypothetical protein